MTKSLDTALDAVSEIGKLDECGEKIHFTLGMIRTISDCRESIKLARGEE